MRINCDLGLFSFEHSDILRLHKPVSDWLETLLHRISGLNMKKKFLLDINEMERNDLWLNVKCNYIFLTALPTPDTREVRGKKCQC